MKYACWLLFAGTVFSARAFAIRPGLPLPLDGMPWSASHAVASPSLPDLPDLPRQPRVERVDLPDGRSVRAVTLFVSAPTHPRYAVHQGLDAVYVVTNAARPDALRRAVGSDYMLALLHQGMPLSALGRGAAMPLDVATPGACRAADLGPFLPPAAAAHFVTEQGGLRRLGDGAYEQRVVATQVQFLIGQPVLAHHLSLQAQYRDLLTAGADFALRQGLRLGDPLTRAQMAKMTRDLVWLVAYPLSMPDGSVRAVLAPQVYLLRREAWR